MTIAQRLNALFIDADERQLIIEGLAGQFICCNNAPDDVSAEALTENNRLPAMSDMAHQSCFITAIAFLKFDNPALDCCLLSLGTAKLQLLSVQAALQFIVLQHGVNPAALFTDLRLLAATR